MKLLFHFLYARYSALTLFSSNVMDNSAKTKEQKQNKHQGSIQFMLSFFFFLQLILSYAILVNGDFYTQRKNTTKE